MERKRGITKRWTRSRGGDKIGTNYADGVAIVSAPFYLRAAPSRLGHRKRYPIKSLPKFTLRNLFFLTTLLAMLTYVGSSIMNEWRMHEQALETSSMLAHLRLDFANWPGQRVSTDQVNKQLEMPEFEKLKSMQISIEKLNGEIAWFQPNRKYRIGILENAQIIWMVNGERVDRPPK